MNKSNKPTVTVIEPTIDMNGVSLTEKKKLKVAAYARVSTEQDEQQNSYQTQISYYTKYILSNPDWEFVGVYSDEGISGTSTKRRAGFNKMIEDALAGKIDLILTKSISRFSRNTVDTLVATRMLREHGVMVEFEKERINSANPASEGYFTMLSSFAQEESRSLSTNVRWGKEKSMMDGKVSMPYKSFLGYKKGADGKPEIVPEEAAVVREIYDLFLNQDKTFNNIAKLLTAKGIKTPAGNEKWTTTTIKSILTNEKYKGDACLQKTFVVDFLTKKVKKNEGERKQYYIHNHHEPIIEPAVFDLVQEKVKRQCKNQRKLSNNSPFTTRIICADCGGYFGHKIQRKKQVWYCNHRYDDKSHTCETPIIPEDSLKTYFTEALAQELARVAATGGYVAPSKAEEAKQAAKLEAARQAAKEALEAALKEFRDEYAAAKKNTDPEAFQKRYNMLTQKMEDKKAALKLAEDAVLDNTARKVNLRRFIEATKNLTAEDIVFSDELFITTVEEIRVSKVRNGAYTLDYRFTNGESVKLNKG